MRDVHIHLRYCSRWIAAQVDSRIKIFNRLPIFNTAAMIMSQTLIHPKRCRVSIVMLLVDMLRTKQISTYPKPQNCIRKLSVMVKVRREATGNYEKPLTTQMQLPMPEIRHQEGQSPNVVEDYMALSVPALPNYPASRWPQTCFGL